MCFIQDTWEGLFDENPQTYEILKNSLVDMDGDPITYTSPIELADDLSHWGGAQGYHGFKDWTKNRVGEFIKGLEDDNLVIKGTYIKFKNELNKTSTSFSRDYLLNVCDTVYNRMVKNYGDEYGSKWKEKNLKDINSKLMKKSQLREIVKRSLTEKKKGKDGKACWKGYRYAGTKNGKDKCVKIKK